MKEDTVGPQLSVFRLTVKAQAVQSHLWDVEIETFFRGIYVTEICTFFAMHIISPKKDFKDLPKKGLFYIF